MSKKYDESFSVDDIPSKCPICKYDFDIQEDIDIDYYKDGIRSVLKCPKCNFKKVLNYDTNEDIAKEMEEI